MNSRIQNDFWDSVIIGERAERELARIFRSKMKNFISVEKVDYKLEGFDLLLKLKVKDEVKEARIEVKDLAGGYDTGVVEVWADDNKTKRPHWWHMGSCDYIFFKDSSRNMWFQYDADKMINFLENYYGGLTRARNQNKDDSGWLAKFYWDPNQNAYHKSFKCDGFIMSFEGEKGE